MKTRKIKKVFESQRFIEGAGVRLNRVFGSHNTPLFDPFLLLDHFQSDQPEDFLAGFPWHPHRGIETVTYMIKGTIEHGDSLGNKGVIHDGDVQWMTAGSGIIHQEMPKNGKGINGFQLWVNLPRKHKMIDPRYQEIKKSNVPETSIGNALVKVICGKVGPAEGPADAVAGEPEYLDVNLPANEIFRYAVPSGRNVFAYIYQGTAHFEEGETVDEKNAILFGDGNEVVVYSGDLPVHFLIISGSPFNEPIAWGGPIVMNNEVELKQAFSEFHEGTFLKTGNKDTGKG